MKTAFNLFSVKSSRISQVNCLFVEISMNVLTASANDMEMET
jgi:hypothetical protein